jgi:hypothetical protein
MKIFLVEVVRNGDTFPLAAFPNEIEAKQFARKLDTRFANESMNYIDYRIEGVNLYNHYHDTIEELRWPSLFRKVLDGI